MSSRLRHASLCLLKCVYMRVSFFRFVFHFTSPGFLCLPTSEGHQWNWKVHFAESNRCRVEIAHCLSNLVSAL